jgi:hypothetical protein
LLPSGSHGVSAKTLGETVEVTQMIVQYAGYDLIHGVNPNFADLRSAGNNVFQLCKLTIEPFEAGSFVIPARLEGQALADSQRRPVTAEDVVQRFNEIFGAFEDTGPATDVSIGAIQAIEALGRVIRREAGEIEFTALDSLSRPKHPIRVTRETVNRVAQVRTTRRTTLAHLEIIDGTITALDIVDQKLHISEASGGARIKGTFSVLFQPSMLECLGRRVRLLGIVERRGKRAISIQVQSVEIPDEEG